MILQAKFKYSFAILTLLVLYSTTVPPHAHAQFVPTVFHASSAFIENKAMYITGGRTSVGNQNSTFSIDFTQYWDASAPVYRLLSTGPSVTWPVPSALIFNSTRWLVLSNTEAYQYDMQLDYWYHNDTPVSYSDVLFTSGAVDPSTDLFYIPNGLRVPGSTLEYTFMQFDIGLNQISNITALGAPDDQLLEFSTTWSQYLRKLVFFGGISQRTKLGSDGLYTFDPVQKAWDKPTIAGSPPSERFGHCGVSMHNGTKLVVFGGFADFAQANPLDDIYIMDTTTMFWTKGASLGGRYGRGKMACGASGDQFVSWGGEYATSSPVIYNITMIYNIVSDTWESRFDPDSKYYG